MGRGRRFGDYQALTDTVTFDPGATTQTISIEINGDTARERNERFFVNLTGAAGATIADGEGLGVIRNDDTPPLILAGAGAGSQIRLLDPLTNHVVHSFSAFGATATATGARVALGDVTGDGVEDIIAGSGSRSGARVRVFDGVTGDRCPARSATSSPLDAGIAAASLSRPAM